MHRKVSLGAAIAVLVAAVLLSSFGAVMAYKTWTPASVVEKGDDAEKTSGGAIDVDAIAKEMNDIKKVIEAYYIYDIDADQIGKYALVGMVAGLGDRYGGYYDPEEYAELMADFDGDMQGIGISVIFNTDLNGIEVIDVFDDSPAMKADLRVGDVIMFCGEDLVSVASLGYDAALATLRGEAGTVAKFVVYRGENYEEEVEFEIERDFVKESSVSWRLCDADPEIGIIRISKFSTATVDQFNEALDVLQAKGVRALIFDVRNNPGGELMSICHILDVLVPEGPVIRTSDKSGDEKVVYFSDSNECTLPMAVIANGRTASAAELFTSALRDYEKAVIIGEKTYGKGSMQSSIPLPNGGCIKLTTALYYPPFSDNYDGVGISPDVEISLSEAAQSKNFYKLTEKEDDQLQAAIKALENK